MLGIGPFFTAFGHMTTVDEALAERPSAWKGLQRTVRRARRSAHLAVHFAMHRQDEDAVMIQQAALLHDFAEMLMWCNHRKWMQKRLSACKSLALIIIALLVLSVLVAFSAVALKPIHL